MIKKFVGRHRYLSNYFMCIFYYKNIPFTNAEAAFQSQKEVAREQEFSILQPEKARSLGKKVNVRKDWAEVQDQIMYDVLYAKFTQNQELKYKLLATGDDEIVETDHWTDTYWGRVDGVGQNKFGNILMKLRRDLRGIK